MTAELYFVRDVWGDTEPYTSRDAAMAAAREHCDDVSADEGSDANSADKIAVLETRVVALGQFKPSSHRSAVECPQCEDAAAEEAED